MSESDKIELHTKFFNAEKVLYSAMSIEERLSHRSELAMMIFEARARMNAIDDVDRGDKARLSKDGKEWIVSNDSNVSISDAINGPKIRKERMSKADKLKESLASLGLDITAVNSIMGDVAKATSGGSITTDHNRTMKDSNAGITFVKNPTSNNTRESLLADVSESLIAGLKDRPIEDLVSAAKTAGNIAHNILGRPWLVDVVEEVEEKKEESFDVSDLFS